MNVLLIADDQFARREAPLLSRLESGLIGEGARITRALPVGCPTGPPGPARVVAYTERGLSLTRGLRAAQLLGEVAEPRRDGEPALDVVHAFGSGSWPIAAEVARRAGAGLAFEVWCSRLSARAAAVRPSGAGQPPTLLLAPDPAIERLLFRQGVGTSVRVAPWGVHTPAQARPILEDGRPTSVMVIGSGVDRGAFAGAVEGLSRAVVAGAEMMIFIDAGAAWGAGVWPLVRRLGLGARVTLTPDMETLRQLTLSGDVLVLPEAQGEHRTLVLEAMARGLAVVAAADPMVTHLADRRTARLVAGPDPSLWAETIGEVVGDAAAARALAESARRFVREEHRVSSHIGLVLDAYEWLASRDSLPLRTRTA